MKDKLNIDNRLKEQTDKWTHTYTIHGLIYTTENIFKEVCWEETQPNNRHWFVAHESDMWQLAQPGHKASKDTSGETIYCHSAKKK